MPAQVIDVHAHILPQRYLDAVRAARLADERRRPVGDGFPFPAWSLEDALRVMIAIQSGPAFFR